jgi:hypothetical protein
MTFGTITATIVNIDGGLADRYGNKAATVAGTYDLQGCNLQKRGASLASEEVIDAGTTITQWLLFAPPPAPPNVLRARDRVRVDAAAAHVAPDAGETYATFDVVGEPDFLDHINGVTHHLELLLERVQL